MKWVWWQVIVLVAVVGLAVEGIVSAWRRGPRCEHDDEDW